MRFPVDRSRGRTARRLALGLLCIAFAAPVLAKEQVLLCFEKKIVAPWRLANQTGLNFDLLAIVEARMNIKFNYQALPWKRCLAKMQTNEVDGAFSVSFTEDRLVFGGYPGGAEPDMRKKLHDSRYMLVRRKGSALDWDGKQLSKLDGPIIFQLGYSVGDLLRRMNIKTEESNDSLNVVAHRILTGNVAGAALYDSDATIVMRMPLAAQLELAPLPLIEKPYFVMFSHALLKRRSQLAERIWQEIEEARSSPDYLRKARAAGVLP
ncbi:MAG: amino acid ABC transporter substrate-binding protein [Pseudomonadota bacterium]